MPTECAQLGLGLGLALGLGLGSGPLRCSWLGVLCLPSVKLDAITARVKQLNEDDRDDDDDNDENDDDDNKAALQ